MSKSAMQFVVGGVVGGALVALAFLLSRAESSVPGASFVVDQDRRDRTTQEAALLSGRGTTSSTDDLEAGVAMPPPKFSDPSFLFKDDGLQWRFKQMPDGRVMTFLIGKWQGGSRRALELDWGWTPAAHETVRALHRLAHEWATADGKAKQPSAKQLNTWLASGTPRQLVRAVGHALRVVPPALDGLVKAAQRDIDPLLRGLALSELARHPAARARAADLILALSASRSDELQILAVDLLSGIGPEGVDKAIALLNDPHAAMALQKQAVRSVVGAPDLASRLSQLHTSEAAWQVVSRINKDRIPAERRAAVGAALGALVEKRASDPAWRGVVYAALPRLPALAARPSVLRIATDVRVARDARIEAVRNAFAVPQLSIEDHNDVLQELLTLPNAEPWFLIEAGVHVNENVLKDPGLKQLVVKLARGHADVWVRQALKERLSAHGLYVEGRIEIIQATYGKPGHVINVTEVVRTHVRNGRLSVHAHNGLRGDPYEGHAKDLVVEYRLDGIPGIRVVREGQTLVLP